MRRILLTFMLLLTISVARAQTGFGVGGTASGTGSGSGTLNTSGCGSSGVIPITSGTSGNLLTCTGNSIDPVTGAATFRLNMTPAAGAADGNTFYFDSWDAGTSGSPIVYAVGQHYRRGFYYTPRFYISGASNPSVTNVGSQIDFSLGYGDQDDIWGFNVIGQNSEATFKASRSLLPFSAFYSFENATTHPLVAGFFAHFDNLAGTGTGTINRLMGFYMDDTAPGWTGGTWASGMTIDNAYGILIDNQQLAGMNATKWVAGAFGGPVLIQDNSSSASATVDNDGWLFWGDSLADGYAQRNFGFRWNADANRTEKSFGTTNVEYETYGGAVHKIAEVVADDIRRQCATAAAGETCVDINPTTKSVDLTGPGSTGAILNVQKSTSASAFNFMAVDENANSQTCAGVNDQVVLCDDSEGDSTQNWKWWIDNNGPYENLNAQTETFSVQVATCNNATADTILGIPTANAATPACSGTNSRYGVLSFSGTGTNVNHAYWRKALPSDWDGGAYTVVLHYVTTATTDIAFNIAAVCYGSGEAVDATPANVVTNNSTPTANNRIDLSFTPSISGCVAGDTLVLDIYRNAATDTATATANLLSFDFTYKRLH